MKFLEKVEEETVEAKIDLEEIDLVYFPTKKLEKNGDTNYCYLNLSDHFNIENTAIGIVQQLEIPSKYNLYYVQKLEEEPIYLIIDKKEINLLKILEEIYEEKGGPNYQSQYRLITRVITILTRIKQGNTNINKIKNFSKISITKICENLSINRSNLMNEKASKQKEELVIHRIIREFTDIL